MYRITYPTQPLSQSATPVIALSHTSSLPLQSVSVQHRLRERRMKTAINLAAPLQIPALQENSETHSALLRLLIVDRFPVVREGLRTLLGAERDLQVVGEAANSGDALALAKRLQPTIVLIDLPAAGMGGVETIQRIQRAAPACQVVVLTNLAEDQWVRDAVRAGVAGYLLKDITKPDLLRALRSAARGEPTLHPEAQRILMRQAVGSESKATCPFAHLTERELSILRLLGQGQCNRAIAGTLFLTEGTVKGYVSIILDKLQVHDRTQAALLAVKHGLVELQ